MSDRGWIFNIQRFSLHDGPGIRTTVFLKGCPLRCQWCHNPEGQQRRPQIRLAINLCARCRRCAQACEHEVHRVTPDAHTLNPANCLLCGKCVEACPAGALEMVGRRMSVAEVLAAVRRDIPFYDHCGGMTLSGGEPLAQLAFSRTLLQQAKAEDIHTVLDTSAFAPWRHLEALAPLVDLFLVDVKHTDDARHRALTGVSNRRILANIRRMVQAGFPLVLRIPWVPTLNADDDFLRGFQSFLASLATVPPVEFIPYHPLGASKRASLGESSAPEEIPSVSNEQIEPLAAILRAMGVSANVAP